MKTVLLVTTASLLYLFGCRLGDDKADLKDLNNYTRSQSTALSQNQCRADADEQTTEFLNTIIAKADAGAKASNTEYVRIQAKDAKQLAVLQKSMTRTLAAVPMNLQQAFFATGGRINVDPNAQQLCLGEYKKLKVHARSFVGEGEIATADVDLKSIVPSGDASAKPATVRNLEISGCWIVVADKTDSNGNVISWHPEVVLSDKIAKDATTGELYGQAIEHSTVRLFGYLLSQILAHLDANVNEEDRFDVSDIKVRVNDLFTAQVSKLLAAVREDVKGSDTNDFFYYKKELATLDKKPAQPTDEYNQLKMAMNHYTFAEAFDSYYCNDKTNIAMQNNFAKTYKIFFNKDNEGRQIGLAAELDYIRVDDLKTETGSLMPSNPTMMFAGLGSGIGAQSLAYELAFKQLAFLRIFRAVGRFVGAVFRGVGRFVVGVYRHVIRPAIRFVARVAVGAARVVWRAATGIVRGALYVAGRVAGHVTTAFAPRFARHMAQFRGAGPFRAGFTDATRFWFPVYRR